MKRPQPDLSKGLIDTFVAKTGANRKLKRLWGTTTVDGVEVLNLRRHYHKASARPDNYKKLFKYLKVWNDVEDYEGDGIKSAWFTLNKSNGPEESGVASSFVEDNLNGMWWDSNDGVMPENLTLTTTIVISEKFESSETIAGIDWSAPKEVQSQYIVDNYEYLWNNKKIVQEGVGVINKGSFVDPVLKTTVVDEDDLSPDDPWLSILARYALRDSGIPCTVKDVEAGLGKDNKLIYNTIVVTIEIPYYSFSSADAIVKNIHGDLDSTAFPRPFGAFMGVKFKGFVSKNEHLTQVSAKQINYYDTADDIDETTVSRSYAQWEDSTLQESLYESFWLKSGNKWYFRADVINDPKAYGTTHVELNTYLFGLLDTGYKKEKVPVWKKIVAVVVFIVAVVVAFIYPPAYVAASSVAAAAYAVMVGAFVLSLVTLAFSSLDMGEWAMAFAWVSKEVEPLVTIASIVLIVTAFAKQGFQEAAKQYVSEELADYAYETILGEFGDLGSIIADAMDGTIDADTMDTINKIASVYATVQLGKLEEISSKNKDLKAEYDKLSEEGARDSDVMRGYMNIYARPATADWSMYAATYDLPYERGGGALSMGNIQRTTKQAIRKPDYEEPMFEGIMLT